MKHNIEIYIAFLAIFVYIINIFQVQSGTEVIYLRNPMLGPI